MKSSNGPKELKEYETDWQLDEKAGYWFLENVLYCKNPAAPSLQHMSLYVPETYRKPDGSWDWNAVCGEYTAKTAPVIFENGIGGYAESRPVKPALSKEGRSEILDAGMIFVSPGARGRQTVNEQGRFIGKSPMGLVDLKSAVRYLRRCAGQIPGDTEKIISVGVSAGGAMSSLLGATGNSERYVPYLKEAGAYPEERDDIFGAMCYCPIIDLEHGNMAYEWMFQGITEYEKRPGTGSGKLGEFHKALSGKLSERYVRYFNGLGLKEPESGRSLVFSEDGTGGPAMEYLLGILNQDAERHMERPKRLKPCPAFDGLELEHAENQELGDETHDRVHFDGCMGEILEELKERYPKEYEKYHRAYEGIGEDKALQERVFLLNPFRFIGTGEKVCTAPHYRIRVGTKDGHTSFTAAMILALKLMNAQTSKVDYKMVWGAGHEKADCDGEFLQWVKTIVKER